MSKKNNSSRPGGKHPNSPRYSDRYGPGHVNPYLGGQSEKSSFIREMEERQETARQQFERRQEEQRQAEHTTVPDTVEAVPDSGMRQRRQDAAQLAVQMQNARMEAQRKWDEAARAAGSGQPRQGRTNAGAARRRSKTDSAPSRAVNDPALKDRLRQIQEQALLEAKEFVRRQGADAEDVEAIKATSDVRMRLSKDNRPLVAIESADSEGNKKLKWVPVVLTDEEMDAFFPTREPDKAKKAELPIVESEDKTDVPDAEQPEASDAEPAVSAESEAEPPVTEEIPAEEEAVQYGVCEEDDELVLIPIAGVEDDDTAAAAVIASAGVVELLSDDSSDDAGDSEPDEPERVDIDDVPAVPVIISDSEADEDDAETPDEADGAEDEDEQSESEETADEPEEDEVPEEDDPEEDPEESEDDGMTEDDEDEAPDAEETDEAADEAEEEPSGDENASSGDLSGEEESEDSTETDEAEADEAEADEAEEEAEPEDTQELPPADAMDAEEEESYEAEDIDDEEEESGAEEAEETEEPAEEPEAEDAEPYVPEEEDHFRRSGHKRRRSRPTDVDIPAVMLEDEEEDRDRSGYDRRRTVAPRPAFDELEASGRYAQSRYTDEDGEQDDTLFRRREKPGTTALFVLPEGASLPKYIDDDDFVEHWLGEEEEDMATVKKRRRRRIAAFIGAATMVLALIGFIAVAKWGLGLLGNIGSSESQKEIYAEYISPVVMSEVPVFEAWDAIPQEKLLQSAVFSVLMDTEVTYERDDTGNFIIPSTDIVNEVKKLYGAYGDDAAQEEEINDKIRSALYGSVSEDTANTDVYYVDMEDSFHVADALSGPAPQVTQISKRDNTITLDVEYLEDLETGSGAMLYSRQFILTLTDDGYFVQAIRELEEDK